MNQVFIKFLVSLVAIVAAQNAFASDMAVGINFLSQPSEQKKAFRFTVVVDNTSTTGGGPKDAPGVSFKTTNTPSIAGVKVTGPRYMPFSYTVVKGTVNFLFLDEVKKGEVFTVYFDALESCDKKKKYGLTKVELSSGITDPDPSNNTAQAAWVCEGIKLSPEESGKLLGSMFLLSD